MSGVSIKGGKGLTSYCLCLEKMVLAAPPFVYVRVVLLLKGNKVEATKSAQVNE